MFPLEDKVNFEPADRLFGIKFWVVYNEHVKPKMQLFKYLGYAPGAGLHWFQGVSNSKAFYSRNHSQLGEQTAFKPFCLDGGKCQ